GSLRVKAWPSGWIEPFGMSCEKPNHWPRRRFPKSNRFPFSQLWGPWSRPEQAADQSEISIFAITFSTSERKPISRRFTANSLKWLWNNHGRSEERRVG